MDLLIDRSAPDRASLLASVNGRIMRSTAKTPRLIRNDGEPVTVRVFDPSSSGARDFDEVDISEAIVRIGIGVPDLAPTAGTFSVKETTENETSGFFAFDGTASALQAALNLFSAIDAAGGVTVECPALGTYVVTFVEPGAQTARFSANTARLAPLSVATVSRVQIGTADVQEVVLIQLVQNAYAFNVLSDPLPSAGNVVEHIQEGTSELPDIQRVQLFPLPYAGSWKLTIAAETIVGIPYNASAAQLQSMLSNAYEVEQIGNSEWIIQTVEPGAITEITVDVAGLTVPAGVKGILALNTQSIWLQFAGNTEKVKRFALEVKLQWPGESSRTILQMPIEMARNVINLDTIASATMLGLQTSYTALFGGISATWTTAITALTGGGAALDAVPTAALALGARYDFYLNGTINSFVLVAGAADPTDPLGEVAPLDFNAGTNNKHWVREL